MTTPTSEIGLRAPRVAIIINGEQDWTFWARMALFEANQLWGGQGFVLIPHHGGKVHPKLLSAAVAYDPDHVLLLRTTLAVMEGVRPGSVTIRDSQGARLQGQPREEAIATSGQLLDDPDGEMARKALSAACTPAWHQHSDSEAYDSLTDLHPGDEPPAFSRAQDAGPAVIAAPPDWTGPLGVAVAARAGVVETPTPRPEGAGLEAPLGLVDWLLSPAEERLPSSSLRELVRGTRSGFGWDASRLSIGWAQTLHGLEPVSRLALPTWFIVIGDSADDFALSLLLDRLYGLGRWVHSN